MRTLSTVLLTIGIMSSLVTAAPAGIAMSVDLDVVNNVKNYAMPIVLRDLNAYQVGKIEFDKGYVDNIQLDLHINDMNSVNVAFSGADNAVKMHAQDIQGTIRGDFRFKFLFIWTHGHFKVTFDKGATTIDALVPLLSTPDGSR